MQFKTESICHLVIELKVNFLTHIGIHNLNMIHAAIPQINSPHRLKGMIQSTAAALGKVIYVSICLNVNIVPL